MYFFWYFSSHLCWSPRYLCLNRSCLSYLLPPLPLSFWDATRQSGRECQQPQPRNFLDGRAPAGQRGPGSLLVPAKFGLRESPVETGISFLLLSAQKLEFHGKPQLLRLTLPFPTPRPLYPSRILFSALNMPIYLTRPSPVSSPPGLYCQTFLCVSMTICSYLIVTQI